MLCIHCAYIGLLEKAAVSYKERRDFPVSLQYRSLGFSYQLYYFIVLKK
jgi:hypothetical protein